MRLTGGQVFDPQAGFVVKDVCLEGGKIVENCQDNGVDVSGCYVIPGLTDVHFHGCVGADVSDADAQGLADMAAYELSRGVTQICPAGMTLAAEQLEKVCTTAAQHRAANVPGAELVGIHLEGHFLAAAKKGAQNGAWLRDPDVALLRHLKECSQGLVKLVSLAPELDGAMDFIREVKDEVSVSLAHTTADYDTAMAAFEAGANHVTHLYNAMPPFAHRDPGVIGAAADSKDAYVEIICDGVHVHPAVIRATFRMMGRERMVLVSDTMRAAGMPDGEYTLGGQAVFVKGNRAELVDGTLAGSVTDLMNCMKTAVSFGIPLEDAVMAAAVNSAKSIGIYDRVGSLDVGKDANVVVLDKDLNLKAVLFRGELVHGAL